MKIYLGSDHQGFMLKEALESWLRKKGHEVEDVGGRVLDPQDDYPQFAQNAALKIVGDPDCHSRGILICGGGHGMAMAANRFKGIRASVVWDEFMISSQHFCRRNSLVQLDTKDELMNLIICRSTE